LLYSPWLYIDNIIQNQIKDKRKTIAFPAQQGEKRKDA
jgi:hypothetical protein